MQYIIILQPLLANWDPLTFTFFSRIFNRTGQGRRSRPGQGGRRRAGARHPDAEQAGPPRLKGLDALSDLMIMILK